MATASTRGRATRGRTTEELRRIGRGALPAFPYTIDNIISASESPRTYYYVVYVPEERSWSPKKKVSFGAVPRVWNKESNRDLIYLPDFRIATRAGQLDIILRGLANLSNDPGWIDAISNPRIYSSETVLETHPLHGEMMAEIEATKTDPANREELRMKTEYFKVNMLRILELLAESSYTIINPAVRGRAATYSGPFDPVKKTRDVQEIFQAMARDPTNDKVLVIAGPSSRVEKTKSGQLIGFRLYNAKESFRDRYQVGNYPLISVASNDANVIAAVNLLGLPASAVESYRDRVSRGDTSFSLTTQGKFGVPVVRAARPGVRQVTLQQGQAPPITATTQTGVIPTSQEILAQGQIPLETEEVYEEIPENVPVTGAFPPETGASVPVTQGGFPPEGLTGGRFMGGPGSPPMSPRDGSPVFERRSRNSSPRRTPGRI